MRVVSLTSQSSFPTSLPLSTAVTSLIFHITHIPSWTEIGSNSPGHSLILECSLLRPARWTHSQPLNFTQIAPSQWSLPYWNLQLPNTLQKPLLCSFHFCTYHLLIYAIVFLFIVIILAPLEYKLHISRMFWSILTHRHILSTMN